jgi:hypothetical protein
MRLDAYICGAPSPTIPAPLSGLVRQTGWQSIHQQAMLTGRKRLRYADCAHWWGAKPLAGFRLHRTQLTAA